MAALGKFFGNFIGRWLGAQEPGDPVNYVDAALTVVGTGTAIIFAEVTQPPVENMVLGRRFLHGGIVFDIDEDDEELTMMLSAAAQLLHRRIACPTRTVSQG